MSEHVTLPILDETGYVVLDRREPAIDPAEWHALEYTAWRSSGITRFAPLTSYDGEIDCNAFWNRTPPRADRDGVWIPSQSQIAPALVRAAQEPGAGVGRCRVVELQPNEYADAIYNLHRDDNNRLNPPEAGRIVRGMLNLTDDPDSLLILRGDRSDPATEVRIPLPAGSQIVVDTERVWHAVWHRGERPRHSLITSWESGPELAAFVDARHGTPRVDCEPLDAEFAAGADKEAQRRIDERERLLEAPGIVDPLPWLTDV